MGRKAIPEDQKKRTVSIALSPEQIKRLQEIAEAWSMTTSQAIGLLIEIYDNRT